MLEVRSLRTDRGRLHRSADRLESMLVVERRAGRTREARGEIGSGSVSGEESVTVFSLYVTAASAVCEVQLPSWVKVGILENCLEESSGSFLSCMAFPLSFSVEASLRGFWTLERDLYSSCVNEDVARPHSMLRGSVCSGEGRPIASTVLPRYTAHVCT